MSGGAKKPRPWQLRPMPESFADDVKVLNVDELILKHRASKHTVARWRRDLGMVLRKLRLPAPEGFAEAAAKSIKAQLSRKYGVTDSVINRWLRETDAKAVVGKGTRRQVPADFTDIGPTLTKTSLQRHYQCEPKTLARWIAETGITPAVYVPEPSAARKVRQAKRLTEITWRPAQCRDLRVRTIYDDAADVIRRERFVVFRCGPTGEYLERGLHWRVGNTILTPDELLERADKYRRRAA